MKTKIQKTLDQIAAQLTAIADFATRSPDCPRNPRPVATYGTYTVRKHGGRLWRVEREDGSLVCLTVYKCGAIEAAQELNALAQRATA